MTYVCTSNGSLVLLLPSRCECGGTSTWAQAATNSTLEASSFRAQLLNAMLKVKYMLNVMFKIKHALMSCRNGVIYVAESARKRFLTVLMYSKLPCQ